MFACQECGRKFKSVKATQRAADNGCPNCGGVDIDLDTSTPTRRQPCDASRGYVDVNGRWIHAGPAQK